MIKHFLQSDEWKKFQISQGKKVFTNSGEGWSYMACLEESDSRFIKSKRLYVPYGPSFDNINSLKMAIKSLEELAKANNAFYIRLEPFGDMSAADKKQLGLIKSNRNTQPDLSWQIDLRQDELSILRGMSSTNRNLWNTAEKKGIKFEITYSLEKLDLFLQMIHNMAERTGVIPHKDDYFKKMAESLFGSKSAGLVFGYLGNEPLVGAMFLDDKKAKTRYYAHAGSFDSARKLQANSPLLCYLIFEAKKLGYTTFDFYGVSPLDQPDHPWFGFSKFKRSFGGNEVVFNGTWELPINKVKYSIFKIGRKIFGAIKN